VFGALLDARASQSLAPPRPFDNVAVTVPPVATLIELTVMVAGGATVKANAPDVPPPGDGVDTLTCAVPAVATSPAEIDACNWVELTNVVARFEPFHLTTEPEMKLLPVTVSVNAAAPASVRSGESALTTGAGLNVESTVTVGLVAARV
jgi:hypothetical protein